MKLQFVTFLFFVLVVSSACAQEAIQVYPGWNNIGALRTGHVPEIVATLPRGIIAGAFYRYSPGAGYSSADTLTKGAGYWVRVNESGLIIFSDGGPPCPGTPTVTYAGKTYNTALIGTQCWLRENLDIGTMVLGSQNQTNNGAIEKYCHSDNPSNCATYGGLYQWNEAMQYVTNEGAQGLCPPGWHVPTSAEFQTLSNTVGGDGNALKRQDQGGGYGGGTNTSGFSALLAGYRDYVRRFSGLGEWGGFWSSTLFDASSANYLVLVARDAVVTLGSHSFNLPYGFSVRCVKD